MREVPHQEIRWNYDILCSEKNWFKTSGNGEGFHLGTTAWKVSKCGVFSDLNTGKYGPGNSPHSDTFQAVYVFSKYEHIGS